MNWLILVIAVFVFGVIATSSVMSGVAGMLGVIVGALIALWGVAQDAKAINARQSTVKTVRRTRRVAQ